MCLSYQNYVLNIQKILPYHTEKLVKPLEKPPSISLLSCPYSLHNWGIMHGFVHFYCSFSTWNENHECDRACICRWLISVPLVFPGEEYRKSASPLGDRKRLIIFLLDRRVSEYKRLIKPFLKLQRFGYFSPPLGRSSRVLLSLLHGKLRHRWTEIVYQRGERLRY